MDHVLDNPAWNALISGNKRLSHGNELHKYFDPEVSPFVGLQTNSTDNLKLLSGVLPIKYPVAFISNKELTIPVDWNLIRCIKCYQMVYQGSKIGGPEVLALTKLSEKNIPQILELIKITKPGPFAARTIEFGEYYGIFENQKLVAMTGHRLQPFEYTEISAVCTHPDYLGKGYAKELLKFHINKIMDQEGIPFLHVRNDNERAIKVYEQMGFKTRIENFFYFIKKAF